MRQAGVVLAVICLLATGEAAASTARATTTSTALATTVVSGPAGSKVYLSLDRTVQMNWLGLDSPILASTGRWEGVLLERTGAGSRNSNRDWYIDYNLTQAELCPGRRCPLPPFDNGAIGGTEHNTGTRSPSVRDGPYTFELPAGTYAIVLLGDPGTRVIATLHLHGLRPGTLRLTAHQHAGLKARFIHPNVTVQGHDVVSRHYLWDTGRGPRFDGLVVGFALAQPATANFGWCATSGPPDSAFCLGGGAVTDGNPGILTNVGGYDYEVDYGLGWSPHGGGSGQGYDAEAVSARSRLVALYFSVTSF